MKEFASIKFWIFDLDNTLYSGKTKVFEQVDKRMSKYISNKLNVSIEEAKKIQKNYFFEYNTTLNGMIKNHKINADEFLEYVHDIDIDFLQKDEKLEKEIKELNGKKIIFTNGSDEHAKNVLKKIGLDKTIDHIFDIIKADYVPKPNILTYRRVIKEYSLDPDKTIMIDDLPNNLKTAKKLGIKTVLIKKDFFNSNTHDYIDIICDNLLDTIKKINKGII